MNNNFKYKLRFPEFENKETWVPRKLSEILFEHKEKSTGKEEVYSVSVHKGVINQIEHLGRRFAASNTENYKRVLPGDIIYTKSPTGDFPLGIIKQSKISKPVIVSPLYGVFQPETTDLGVILDAYFEYPEKTINYLSSIVQKGAKNTININNDTFLSKSLVLPIDKSEQQKIAACLSSLDEVITTESQKLVILKDHKKGLLQNLLPQEGETVPKFRFKEFEDSGEWEDKMLDEVTEFLKGKGISKVDTVENGKQPCIRYGELYTHYGEVIKDIKSFTNLPVAELMLSEENDVIIPSSGETREDIATASCIKLKGVALGGDLNILRSNINGEFLAYYLSHGLKKAISKIAQGDAVVHLYSSSLKKIKLRIPKSKKEQGIIASCLSTLDDLVTIQNQKVEALKLHKKGLLQGLFPDVNTITE